MVAKSHELPNKQQRKPKPCKYNGQVILKTADYNRVDNVITEVVDDICKGTPRHIILENLTHSNYSSQTKPLSQSVSEDYYRTAVKRLRNQINEREEELVDIYTARYETILNEAVKNGDRLTAKSILDSLVKLLGLANRNNTVTVKDDNKEINISFGFES